MKRKINIERRLLATFFALGGKLERERAWLLLNRKVIVHERPQW